MTAEAASDGTTSGSVTCHNTAYCGHPSTRAASSTSIGTASMDPFRIHSKFAMSVK